MEDIKKKNRRSGTENVAEIVGLGKACNIAQYDMSSYINKLKYFRDYFINQIRQKFPNCHINGSLEQRLPGNCNLCFENINSSELLLKLDAVGICASGGSACSSGDTAPSHVLSAIGVPNDLARGALRITFGDFNTFEDVEFLIKKSGRNSEKLIFLGTEADVLGTDSKNTTDKFNKIINVIWFNNFLGSIHKLKISKIKQCNPSA